LSVGAGWRQKIPQRLIKKDRPIDPGDSPCWLGPKENIVGEVIII
jgi:hypothetical protein